MPHWLLTLAFATAAPAQLSPFLARISEEAETFFRIAPQTVSEETLHQRAAVAKRRFLPRVGKAALEREYHYKTRRVVSEYTYSSLNQDPDFMHEFRQVLSVDERPVASREKARRTLTLGVRSPDDEVKKRMLEEFTRMGLVEPAVDFGQILLLFRRRNLSDFRFSNPREGLLGAEQVIIHGFEQVSGQGAFTIFYGRQLVSLPVRGEVWSRRSDLLPRRIVLRVNRDGESGRRDEAVVDYVMSPHGILVPASIVHTLWEGKLLLVENRYSYAPFRRFAAEAEIKFTEVPQQ
jgi:hypothetical protein